MNRLLIFSLLALALVAGCSGRPRRVPVSGKVTIDGKPLTSGFIQVVPDNARAAVSRIDSAGHFKLETYGEGDGCVLGTHRVIIVANQTLSPTKTRWLAPPKYRDPSTSGVSVEIDGPKDNLEIALSWNGAEPFVEESVSNLGDSDPAKIK